MMGFYQSVIRPIAFQFDPEFVHNLAMKAIINGWVRSSKFEDQRLNRTLLGIRFPNPLGLAAGFDKNALALLRWHNLGFGFAEIGTITYHPQPGQQKPRMFRLPQEKALINRMGFNNDGALVISEKLRHNARASQIPLGINIGKSKITPNDESAEDYQKSARLLDQFGDYLVINVSSPNTPGLRALQSPNELAKIVDAVRIQGSNKPIFVKIAPDLPNDEIDEITDFAMESRVQGIIASNTALSRDGLKQDPQIEGGLSGQPIRKRSNEVLGRIAQRADRKLVLIGVGGIMNGDDLYEKIQLGADLCQVYTGWIYGGPDFVPRCLERYLTLSTRSQS